MLKKFRHLRISLAAKCQILFGAAVVLIIGAALYVPWKRMGDLMTERNLQTAEVLAMQEKYDHVAEETALARNPQLARPTPQPSPIIANDSQPSYIPARLIPVHPRKGMDLDKFEKYALRLFIDHPNEYHHPLSYRLRDQERYRLAMPMYTDQSCLNCHASDTPTLSLPPALPPRPASGVVPTATNPSPARLVGIITVDIPSQVNTNQAFLNRVFILLAGLFAGIVAACIFYIITTQLILQPVRVLQETAEKVSQGDLNIRSDISTGDEFQQLSETFNTMLTNLKSSADQLRSINKGLDLKLGQLAEMNVALYESNRLKSEFLANVSHELRTPLNSILGFAELLRDTVAAGIDGKPARYLQNILSSGQNLLELINDLLDLAKIEAGKMDVRSEPISLGDLFEGLSNILKPLSEAKSVAIAPEVITGVPIIHTDPAKLQQVLYNFLSNAIKFSPPGARVDLVARNEDHDHVRISVSDKGPGIEPDKHEMIFEKFRQIDGSVTRQHSGTGLGLAISKELTMLMGGTIGIDSQPGEGATFWVVLPLKTQAGTRDLRAKMILTG